jgi:hypothetical protein
MKYYVDKLGFYSKLALAKNVAFSDRKLKYQ